MWPQPKNRRAILIGCYRFFSTLKPKLVFDDIVFTHGLPTWDATDPAVFYTGDSPFTNSVVKDQFDRSGHQIIIVGHFHRWFLANDCAEIKWNGMTEVVFSPTQKYFVIVEAVFHGGFAVVDTKSKTLTPCSVTK